MMPGDEHDDVLMERLRRIAAEVDPPPPDVLAAARAALATRRLDDELAELVMDSELEGAGQVRGPGDVRLLSFESAAVSVELQVQETPGGPALRGLVDGAVGPVVLETPAGESRAELSAEGWFSVAAAPSGPVRLRLRTPAGVAVTSAWVVL